MTAIDLGNISPTREAFGQKIADARSVGKLLQPAFDLLIVDVSNNAVGRRTGNDMVLTCARLPASLTLQY
jgi:hypothetical protein